MPSLLRADKEIIQIYERNVKSVYHVCYSFMKNKHDTEDMVQETFLRLISSGQEFRDERHEKAWLIVTASNLCKDNLKRYWRREETIEDHYELAAPEDERDNPVLDCILSMPKDYRTVVYMHYYEGYTSAEIARHLHIPHGTVRTRIARAKKLLKTMLGGESDDETANQRSL